MALYVCYGVAGVLRTSVPAPLYLLDWVCEIAPTRLHSAEDEVSFLQTYLVLLIPVAEVVVADPVVPLIPVAE